MLDASEHIRLLRQRPCDLRRQRVHQPPVGAGEGLVGGSGDGFAGAEAAAGEVAAGLADGPHGFQRDPLEAVGLEALHVDRHAQRGLGDAGLGPGDAAGIGAAAGQVGGDAAGDLGF